MTSSKRPITSCDGCSRLTRKVPSRLWAQYPRYCNTHPQPHCISPTARCCPPSFKTCTGRENQAYLGDAVCRGAVEPGGDLVKAEDAATPHQQLPRRQPPPLPAADPAARAGRQEGSARDGLSSQSPATPPTAAPVLFYLPLLTGPGRRPRRCRPRPPGPAGEARPPQTSRRCPACSPAGSCAAPAQPPEHT